MKHGTMKNAGLVGVLLATALPAQALIVTEPTQTWSVGYTVSDDGNTAGPFGIEVAGSAIEAITRVEVGLSFSGLPGETPGDWATLAGDLVVTLAWVPVGGGPADIITSHLLNRIGVGTVEGGIVGFEYTALNVTLSDDAAGGDIHTASLVGATLTGAFEPDGRAAATGNERDFRLNVFNGRPANGSWQLYVTDAVGSGLMESGGQMRLDSWSLSLTGDTQVPESSTWAAGAALLGLVAWRRWRSR